MNNVHSILYLIYIYYTIVFQLPYRYILNMYIYVYIYIYIFIYIYI